MSSKPISPSPVAGGALGELPAYVSNGLIGLRVRDNPLAAGMTLVNGLAGRHPVRKIEAAALAPYPLACDFRIDGIWLSEALHALRIEEQAYDFETAELTTRVRLELPRQTVAFEVVTFCSRDEPTIACQEIAFEASRAADVVVRPMVDARGVEGNALSHERLTPGEPATPGDGWLLWETAGGLSTCGVAFASEILGAEAEVDGPPLQRGRLYSDHRFKVRARKRYRLRQMASLVPSALHDQPDQQAARLLSAARRAGFDTLRKANRKQWADLWRSRIQIVGADERWQALVDAAFFYTMTSVHPSSPASTSIFGLATWRGYHYYYGHVMWDIDTFVVPPLAFLQPGAAEALLDYRADNLENARRNAMLRGRQGLQFPWEAGPATGMEAAPLPGSASWHEDHISPDVAHAFAVFSAATGDERFMREKAWPVLEGVAEWVASRTIPTGRGDEIKASMGIAERVESCDNPAFAVAACQAALDDAMRMAEHLDQPSPADWTKVRDGLVWPLRDGNILVSHDGYRVNEEKGATPDPLMAFFPLWRELGPEVERATLDFYLSMAKDYVGAPMLSALYGVWAAWSGDRALSARLLDEGYAQFISGRFDQTLEYRKDVFPEQPPAGPFFANIGGFLTSLLLGFPALRPDLGPPETWPRRPVVLPEGWEAIVVDHLWVRGRRYRLEARHGAERATLTPR